MKTAANALYQSLSPYIAKLASGEEIRQAMRLRYEVFAEEENNPYLVNKERLEKDLYDPYCDHLIVKEVATNKVIGTYRLLPGKRAINNIGFYSETEFDLTAFHSHKERTLELGRSCVDHEYRDGKVIQMLWEGIAQYVSNHPYDYLIGCASVPFKSLEKLNEVYSLLYHKKVINSNLGIAPRETHRVEGLQLIDITAREKELSRSLPPLIKGYQWIGAEIGGPPAYDPTFQTIDFFIVLNKHQLTKRYKRQREKALDHLNKLLEYRVRSAPEQWFYWFNAHERFTD